ncbi:MAG: fimbrillin family protein [Prevotella sp.]
MRKRTFLSVILLLSVLAACQNSDLPAEEGAPLSFSTQQTRTGLSSLFENFQVWGTCITDGGSAGIMPGYRVNYNVTVGWTYSIGEGTEYQTLQYWNNAASMYRFHAGAPAARVHAIAESSLTLGMKATTMLSETCLYSKPCEVRRTDPAFGNVVDLTFTYANACVNLAFKYLSDTQTSITDIRLIPPSPYATVASLRIDYNWMLSATSPGTLTASERSSDALSFPDVAVPANSDAAVQTAVPWYMIPDPYATGTWKVCITIGSETKEAEFTIDEPWEPGRAYVYRFEYTAEANLVFAGTATELFVGESLEDGGTHNFN